VGGLSRYHERGGERLCKTMSGSRHVGATALRAVLRAPVASITQPALRTVVALPRSDARAVESRTAPGVGFAASALRCARPRCPPPPPPPQPQHRLQTHPTGTTQPRVSGMERRPGTERALETCRLFWGCPPRQMRAPPINAGAPFNQPRDELTCELHGIMWHGIHPHMRWRV
jgi:hypothetical protein